MDKLYRVVIIDDDEFSADNLCLELKKYNRLSIDGMARNGMNGRFIRICCSWTWNCRT